ncbi:MAG: hypothetical protein KDF60_12535 [Calditrichaeota bacterium]|nr:hypothetical protein [Calditrichota bacterium]
MNQEKPVLIDIPKQFYSDAVNRLFSNCLNCNRFLLEENTEYIIEKAVRRYNDYDTNDTIFEYAICMKCHSEIISVYSESSLKSIQNYFQTNVNFQERQRIINEKIEQGKLDIQDYTSRCLIKGTPINKLNEYQIGCQCIGNKMLANNMPFLIGNEAMDELSQLLSNQTIGEMNRFIDEFLGLPPDLRKLLKDSGVLIL